MLRFTILIQHPQSSLTLPLTLTPCRFGMMLQVSPHQFRGTTTLASFTYPPPSRPSEAKRTGCGMRSIHTGTLTLPWEAATPSHLTALMTHSLIKLRTLSNTRESKLSCTSKPQALLDTTWLWVLSGTLLLGGRRMEASASKYHARSPCAE